MLDTNGHLGSIHTKHIGDPASWGFAAIPLMPRFQPRFALPPPHSFANGWLGFGHELVLREEVWRWLVLRLLRHHLADLGGLVDLHA